MNLGEYQQELSSNAKSICDTASVLIAEELSIPKSLVRVILREKENELALIQEITPEIEVKLLQYVAKKVAKKELETRIDKSTRVNFVKKLGLSEAARRIPFGKTQPPKDPDTRGYIPQFTTPELFNDHVAEVVEPYVLALIRNVAKERKLSPPSDEEVERVLKKIDWAEAAYFAQEKRANPTRVRKFLDKYVVSPMKKAIYGFPAEKILFVTQSLIIGTTLYKLLSSTGFGSVSIPPKNTKLTQILHSVFKYRVMKL
jgi:spore cortex formation protein SpoVR/YcgB (stage V sporulation)